MSSHPGEKCNSHRNKSLPLAEASGWSPPSTSCRPNDDVHLHNLLWRVSWGVKERFTTLTSLWGWRQNLQWPDWVFLRPVTCNLQSDSEGSCICRNMTGRKLKAVKTGEVWFQQFLRISADKGRGLLRNAFHNLSKLYVNHWFLRSCLQSVDCLRCNLPQWSEVLVRRRAISSPSQLSTQEKKTNDIRGKVATLK